jgi:hypothetical protein
MRQHIITAILVVGITANAGAQDSCPSGRRVPDFGYGMILCRDCVSTTLRDGVPVQRFSSEPALYRIRTNGPAMGKVNEGDTLVAVDGFRIRSDEAAQRLSEWKAEAATLTLRSNGTTRTVSITPVPVCVGRAAVGSAIPDPADTLRARQQYDAGIITRAEYERRLGRHAIADSLDRVTAEARYRIGAISRAEYARAMGQYERADSLAAANLIMRYNLGSVSLEEVYRQLGRPRADSMLNARPLRGGGRGVAVGAGRGGGARQGGRAVMGTAVGGAGSTRGGGTVAIGAAVGGARGVRAPVTAAGPTMSEKVGNATVEVLGGSARWTRNPLTGELRILTDSLVIIIKPPPPP